MGEPSSPRFGVKIKIFETTSLSFFYLVPETSILKWLFQLDDEPNLYEWGMFFSSNIHDKKIVWGSR